MLSRASRAVLQYNIRKFSGFTSRLAFRASCSPCEKNEANEDGDSLFSQLGSDSGELNAAKKSAKGIGGFFPFVPEEDLRPPQLPGFFSEPSEEKSAQSEYKPVEKENTGPASYKPPAFYYRSSTSLRNASASTGPPPSPPQPPKPSWFQPTNSGTSGFQLSSQAEGIDREDISNDSVPASSSEASPADEKRFTAARTESVDALNSSTFISESAVNESDRSSSEGIPAVPIGEIQGRFLQKTTRRFSPMDGKVDGGHVRSNGRQPVVSSERGAFNSWRRENSTNSSHAVNDQGKHGQTSGNSYRQYESPAGLPPAKDTTRSPLLKRFESGVLTLTLNRPESANRLTWPMYDILTKHLTHANLDSDVHVVVLTGAGDAFSAGDEPSNADFPENVPLSKDSLIDGACSRIKELVDAVIHLNKPVIAAVNGHCYGLPFFMLPLLDFVFCSSQAKFGAAVVELCQTPYGCASLTFPQVMGNSNANEVFLRSREFSAEDAIRLNIVSYAFPDGKMLSHVVQGYATRLTNLPHSVRGSFKHFRHHSRQDLLKVNEEEIGSLRLFWRSEEFQSIAMKVSQIL